MKKLLLRQMLKRLEHSLFFLTLLFLPTQLGRHFWPEFSSVFSLPVDYLSPVIYFWDILVILLAVISIKKWKWQLPLTLVGIFLLSQLISLLNAANPAAGLVRWEQLFTVSLFGLYICQQNWLKVKSQLFWPLLIGFLFEASLALIQFFNQGTVGLWILGERTFTLDTPSIAKFNLSNFEFLRPYATFPHPNVLAANMLITGTLLYFLIVPVVRKWIIIVAAIVIGIAFSRAVWIAGLLWLFHYLRRYWLVAAVTLPLVVWHLASLLNYDALSFLRRSDLNSSAWSLFLQHPMFGVGLNNFISVIASDTSIAGPSRFLQPVHNIVLLLLAETGAVGFIGFLVLVSWPIFKLWTSRAHIWSRVLLGLWVTILWLGLFDHYFLTLAQGQRLLFLIWGLSMLQLTREHGSKDL